jgi:ubiquinone/menaquinone biosynthesis C-methylase UbiE
VSPDLPPVQALFSGAHARWWSELYAREIQTPEAHFFRQRRDAVLALLAQRVPQDRPVLDLGCGAGPVLAALRAAGWSCTGLDGAPDMLGQARERLAAAGLSSEDLHLGDCRATPFEANRFDAVLCLGVISYVEDYRPVLREIHRVLRPGGLAVVSCRNAANPVLSDPWRLATGLVRRLLRRVRPEPFTPGRFLDRSVVREQLERAGLVVEREVGIGFGPPRLAGRPLLGDAAAIRLSDAIGRLASRAGLWPLARRATDISLWVLRKPDGSGEGT